MRISPKIVERTETRKGHWVASNVELSPHFLSGSQAEQEHPVTKHAWGTAGLVFSQQFVECFVLTANQVIFALQKATKNHEMDQ